MKAALYCRVSTQEQARHGESIEDQLQALRSWARDHRVTVAGEYLDEGFSARKSYRTRPAMQRLLADVEAGKIDCIIFTKLDRWFRSLSDYYKVQDVLEEHGTTWTAILEDYTTETSEGVFKVNLMLSFAQREADITSDRIRFTFAQKRERGEIISGRMPMGYRLQDHKPVKDEEKQDAVAAFWSTYLSVGSLNKARESAERLGLFLPVNVCSLMLRNAEKYAGRIQNCPCEPYISEEEAKRVLATRRRAPRKSGRVYLFSGMIYCRECGGRMGAHLFRYGQDKHRVCYNCSDHNMMRRQDRCGNRVNISEPDVEKALLQQLAPALQGARMEAEMREKERPAQHDAAVAEREKLLRKQEKLLDLYLDGLLDKEAYGQRKKALQDQIDAIVIEPVPEAIPPEAYDALLPEDWRDIYAALDDEHRRAFWFNVVSRIEVGADRSVSIVNFCVSTT